MKEKILKRWKEFAEKNGLEFNQNINVDLKLDTCTKYGGACPCLPRWRKECPLPECLEDIEEANACYCMVFKKSDKDIDYAEHSKMTLKVRQRLGL